MNGQSPGGSLLTAWRLPIHFHAANAAKRENPKRVFSREPFGLEEEVPQKGRGELAHRLETAHSFSCGECRKARKPQKGFRAWPFGAEGQEKAPWGGRRARKSL